jgi:hypothetical protein
VAGHAIDHRSDVFFLRGVLADGQDLLVGKIRQGAFDLRDKPEPADQAGAFDSLEFRGWLSRGHECLAFRLPFADKLLKQFIANSRHTIHCFSLPMDYLKLRDPAQTSMTIGAW